MPVILLERLPLPSLRVYTAISAVLLSCSVYYAAHSTRDPNWKTNSTSQGSVGDGETLDPTQVDSNFFIEELRQKSTVFSCLSDIVSFMVQEPICIWTLINTAYCTLLLLGKFIQKLVFGELRVSEQQHLKDRFWNFVFYKFIFVFGIINVQYMDEVIMWCAWFSVLGSLHLLAQICKDRFEYLSFSPTTPGWSHARLVALLVTILLLSGLMFLVCVAVGFFGGLNTFAFMAAECVLLKVRVLQTLLRYALHLYDVRGGGGRVWEKRGPLAYYTQLFFELSALFIELLHHVHMLLWSNIFISMASLVICMHLRYLMHEIQRRIKKHRNYLWVLYHMEQSYPMASSKELAENSDNCAICWEKMESARKLPCTHLFHNSCLQSWLEQDTSCPTCRLALSIHSLSSQRNIDLNEPANLVPNRPRPNHFFHFDGSRYVSWLPSFSVEVTHAQLLRNDHPSPTHTSQLDSMARQVHQLFPHIPMNAIIEDLHQTRSIELTVENVLDGRLIVPLQPPEEPPTPVVSAPSPTVSWHASSDSTEAEDEPINLGGRFSKSSSERERILHLRKEKLLHAARRKYLERHAQSS